MFVKYDTMQSLYAQTSTANIQALIDYLKANQIAYETEAELKAKTWIKRGGVAHLWVQPTNLVEFVELAKLCQRSAGVRYEVVGNTSNCYFLNDYNPDVVISTLKLNRMHVASETITCDCGFNLSRLAKYCISNGIAGFEGFVGVPGTVGGAAINNAGSYGSLVSDVLTEVVVLINGVRCILTNEQLEYRNRTSALKAKRIDAVVVSVTFRANAKEDPALLAARARDSQIHRRTFQEHDAPNLGTTFCTLDFKRLPFHLRWVSNIADRIAEFVIRNPVKLLTTKTRLFLWLRGAGAFRRYVSGYGVQCFTWKDSNADYAFVEYKKFIEQQTHKAVIEIDIKGRSSSSGHISNCETTGNSS